MSSDTTYDSSMSIGGVELKDIRLKPEDRRKNAAILAAGYTPFKRRFEIVMMTLFLILECIVAYSAISETSRHQVWMILPMFFLGAWVTDFVSGVAHWSFDTWGKLDTPVIGPSFIRSFREHHIDPTAMCTHDFIETNADPALFSVALNTYLMFRGIESGSNYDLALFYFALSGGFFAAFTNEFHKWSHMYKAPAWIKFLQDSWIVLPRKHHAVHHRPPFDRTYCITTGHLNPLLDYIDFWRKFERAITFCTGAKPREDDQLWTGQIYGEKGDDSKKDQKKDQ